MVKSEIRIVVFNDTITYDIPENPKEFFNYFASKLRLVPKEYRKVAKFEIEADSSYGSPYIDFSVCYNRIETDEEFKRRKQRVKQQQEFKENQELCELERLKKKYNV